MNKRSIFSLIAVGVASIIFCLSSIGIGFIVSNITSSKAVSGPLSFPKYSTIAAGDAFSVAIDVNGDLWTWGQNWNGKLGVGYENYSIPTPTNISKIHGFDTAGIKFKDVKSQRDLTAALDTNGYLYVWGNMPWIMIYMKDIISKTSLFQRKKAN